MNINSSILTDYNSFIFTHTTFRGASILPLIENNINIRKKLIGGLGVIEWMIEGNTNVFPYN